MKSKRIAWIDLYKAIGFFFVILGHLEIGDNLSLLVYSFHMPLFLLATGFTMNFEKIYHTKFIPYFWTRFKRLLIPYGWMQMISLTILYLRRLIIGGRLPDLIAYLKGILISNTEVNPHSPSPALYYIVLLFFAELGLWVFIKLSKNNKKIVFLLLLAILPITLLTIGKKTVMHLNVVPVTMMFIFIGRISMDIYQSALKEKLEKLSGVSYLFLCSFLLLAGLTLAVLNGRFSLNGNLYGDDFLLSVISALLTNYAIALIAMKLPAVPIFVYIGQSTLFYMGIHSQIRSLFEQVGRSFADIESHEFIIFALLIIFFGLAPLSIITDKYFPFVVGKSTAETKDKTLRLGRYFMTFFAFSPIFYVTAAYLVSTYFPALISGTGEKIVYYLCATVLWAAVSCIGCLIVEKLLPFVFLIEKSKTVSEIQNNNIAVNGETT